MKGIQEQQEIIKKQQDEIERLKNVEVKLQQIVQRLEVLEKK